MPLTEQQKAAIPILRAMFANNPPKLGVAKSFEDRARLPTVGIPEDITAHVEIAPLSPNPHPLLPSNILKTPERVPIFFYALRSVNDSETAPNPRDVKVIFHIHGGGNIGGHPTAPMFVNLFAELLRAFASQSFGASGCIVVAPCYRLATVPENAFPAALQDLVSAYDHILGKGYHPGNITISGDSAGGNHAFVLSYLVSQSNRPLPDSIVALSPAAIQVYDRLSEHAKAQADADILSLHIVQTASIAYVGDSGVAATDPLISGCFIPFAEESSWPRTLILDGTANQLIDASREIERRLRRSGRSVELVEYDEVPHGWWAMGSVFSKEIRDTATKIARFVLWRSPIGKNGQVPASVAK